MVATHSPEATAGGAGERAGATSAPQANLCLQSAKINRRCWLHIQTPPWFLPDIEETHGAPCQDPSACSPSWKTGVQHRQKWGPRAQRPPPSTPTVLAASLEKSCSHDGKAQGKNDCRQMGLMWTRTSEHFFSSFGGLASSNRG